MLKAVTPGDSGGSDVFSDFGELSDFANPFRGSIVGDPWQTTNDQADVDRIHQRVFQTCCAAVESARSDQGSAGIIINGEPGSGKTHLIGRLRRRLTDDLAHPTLDRSRQAFAYVRLDTSACSLARHVRRKVADDLLRKVGGPNQFERMVITRLMELTDGAGHLAPWWEHFRDERLHEAREMLTELCYQEGLSSAFVEVLTHLIARRHRLDVASWLRGDPLTPAALDRLGIAQEDSEDHPEQIAERCLSDIMKLAGSKMPLVICFDQVEALQTAPDDVQSMFRFGQLVSQLHDSDRNLVMISCMQSSMYEQIRTVLPQYMLDRLWNFKTETLNPLPADLAGLLISHRLEASGIAKIRPSDAGGLWPFSASDIDSFVGDFGVTPRRLLDQAARRFDELTGRAERIPVPRAGEPISDEWERRLEKSTRENERSQSVGILRSGLQHLVHIANSDWKTETDPTGVLDFIFVAPQNEARVGVKVCDDSPVRLASQVRKLAQLFPKSLKIQKLILLKDERSPVSRNATATQGHLTTLQVDGAVFHQVAPEAFAALDALRQLLADVKSGDLDLNGQNVSVRSVTDWLRVHLPPVLADLAEVLTLPSAGAGFDQSNLIERLQEYLNEHRISRMADVAGTLGASSDELMAAASERTDLFRILDGGEVVVYSVRNSMSPVSDMA